MGESSSGGIFLWTFEVGAFEHYRILMPKWNVQPK